MAIEAKYEPILRYATMLPVLNEIGISERRVWNIYRFDSFLVRSEKFLALYPRHKLSPEVSQKDSLAWEQFASPGFVLKYGKYRTLQEMATEAEEEYEKYVRQSISLERVKLIRCIRDSTGLEYEEIDLRKPVISSGLKRNKIYGLYKGILEDKYQNCKSI